MITAIESRKMVVISDLHLGNPFSQNSKQANHFLYWAASQGYDICINGDGLEIAQASFSKLAEDLPAPIRVLREIKQMGRNVYYVVGNHDIALEHFLEDWGMLKVSPFLNVSCGDLRIRIEHGHLYDPFFVKHPDLYEFLTRFAGLLIKVHPKVYMLWIYLERFRARLRARKTKIVGEPPEFAEAAYELSRRGFDIVIFGHTHHRGDMTLPNGKKYYNSGSWMLSNHYLEITDGVVESKLWDRKSELT
jgi:UDP-2,3-diacylglucosamine pyrophosphatase LpxH